MEATQTTEPKSTKLDACIGDADYGVTLVERKVGWRRLFLKALAQHGKPTFAAKEAGVSVPLVYKVKAKSPRFAKAWANAVLVARRARIDRIEAEIERRGIDGWDDPIVSNGEIIDYRKKYDGTLALAVAARNSKAWRKQRDSSHTVNVLVSHDIRNRMLEDPEYARLACQMAALEGKASGPEIEV